MIFARRGRYEIGNQHLSKALDKDLEPCLWSDFIWNNEAFLV